MLRVLSRIAVPLLLFCLWYTVSKTGSIPAILLPAPEAVFASFVELLLNGTLLTHTLSSASRTLIGFLTAASVGIGLGLACARSMWIYRLSYLSIETVRVTPPLALIPLLILWLGIDEAPKIAIVFLSSVFPIYLNTYSAIRSIDPKMKELAQLMRFTPMEMFRYLFVPGALPGILTGLRLGFGYSWRALVGAELIAASTGLGFLISESAEFAKTETVFVGIFTIAILGVVADFALSLLVRRLTNYFQGGRRG